MIMNVQSLYFVGMVWILLFFGACVIQPCVSYPHEDTLLRRDKRFLFDPTETYKSLCCVCDDLSPDPRERCSNTYCNIQSCEYCAADINFNGTHLNRRQSCGIHLSCVHNYKQTLATPACTSLDQRIPDFGLSGNQTGNTWCHYCCEIPTSSGTDNYCWRKDINYVHFNIGPICKSCIGEDCYDRSPGHFETVVECSVGEPYCINKVTFDEQGQRYAIEKGCASYPACYFGSYLHQQYYPECVNNTNVSPSSHNSLCNYCCDSRLTEPNPCNSNAVPDNQLSYDTTTTSTPTKTTSMSAPTTSPSTTFPTSTPTSSASTATASTPTSSTSTSTASTPTSSTSTSTASSPTSSTTKSTTSSSTSLPTKTTTSTSTQPSTTPVFKIPTKPRLTAISNKTPANQSTTTSSYSSVTRSDFSTGLTNKSTNTSPIATAHTSKSVTLQPFTTNMNTTIKPFTNVSSLSISKLTTADMPSPKSTKKSTTTVDPPRTIPPLPTTCSVCLPNVPNQLQICEQLKHSVQCEPPNNYCINHIMNREDGSRLVNRTCGNFDLCYREWFVGSSDNDKCQHFYPDDNQILAQKFECTYCCIKDNCNIPLHPARDTLYADN